MKSTYNGHTIELYSSLDMPIYRFQEYNRAVAIDAGIGSDMGDFAGHIGRIKQYIEADPKLAYKELDNLYANVQMVMEGVNPELLSFVPLIRKINNRELTAADMTDEGKKQIIKELAEKKFSIGFIRTMLAKVKKKFKPNLGRSSLKSQTAV